MGKLKNILAGCFVFIAVTASLYSCLDDETDMTEEETPSVSDEKEDHGSSGGKHDTGANGSGAAGTPRSHQPKCQRNGNTDGGRRYMDGVCVHVRF